MCSDLPVLHDLLGDLASTDASSGTVTDGSILVATIELEVFNALQDLLVQLLLDDLSFYDCIRSDGVVLIELLIYLIDL